MIAKNNHFLKFLAINDDFSKMLHNAFDVVCCFVLDFNVKTLNNIVNTLWLSKQIRVELLMHTIFRIDADFISWTITR